MRVFCYYNLHRKCFSLKALEGPNKGRVIAHASAVRLTSVHFKVSAAGRERVIAEKRKNVHAGVVGSLVAHVLVGEKPPTAWTRFARRMRSSTTQITYDPYQYATFVTCENRTPVAKATECLLAERKVWANGIQS